MSYGDSNYHNESYRADRLKRCSEKLANLDLEITKKARHFKSPNKNLDRSSLEILKPLLWTKIFELDMIDTENDTELGNIRKKIHSYILELLALNNNNNKNGEHDKNIIEKSEASENILNVGEQENNREDRLKICSQKLESLELEITTKARRYFAYYKSTESASFANVKPFLWTKLTELDMINTENDSDLSKIKKNLHIYLHQLLESNGTNIKKKEEIDANTIKNPKSLEKIFNIRKEAAKLSEEIDECEDSEDELDDLKGSLLNLIALLDEVDIEGDELLRAERKKTLIYIHNLIETIESKID